MAALAARDASFQTQHADSASNFFWPLLTGVTLTTEGGRGGCKLYTAPGVTSYEGAVRIPHTSPTSPRDWNKACIQPHLFEEQKEIQ